MADDPLHPFAAPEPLIPLEPEAPVLTDQEKAAATAAEAEAAEKQKEADTAKAKADDELAAQKAAHVVLIVGGKSPLGSANSTGNDGVEIKSDGPLTVVLVKTLNPSGVNHPGTDTSCVARLPGESKIGDVVEVYCVPDENGSSAFVHPPKDESIGTLPVSTGDNTGTCVEVPAATGRSFRKVSTTAWQVLGG